MEITEAIVHGLAKDAGSSTVTENFRHQQTQAGHYLEALASGLCEEYARALNNYGRFDDDVQTYPFSTRLSEYVAGKTALVQFSQQTCKLIKSQMEISPPATGGYGCFLRYTNQGRDWLLIAMLKLKANVTIHEASLELEESTAFDMSHLHEAARIDLTAWNAATGNPGAPAPYLSFIKRRGRQDEVTRYFRHALGCTQYSSARDNTRAAIDAVDAYAKGNNWTAEQRQAARKRVFEFFAERSRADEEVHRDALSAVVNPQDPAGYSTYLATNNIPVNEVFAPHKPTYRRLDRISGKFGGVSVAFDVDDVLDDRVLYNEKEQTLVISNPPDSLVRAIRQAKGDDDTDQQA